MIFKVKHNIFLIDPVTNSFFPMLAISTSRISLTPPWPALLSSFSLFLLSQRTVNNGYVFLWTTLLASALLLLCIHSKCLSTTLWSLLQIFTPLLNPAPLLTEMMLLCYPAALSLTCFHFAGEILWQKHNICLIDCCDSFALWSPVCCS